MARRLKPTHKPVKSYYTTLKQLRAQGVSAEMELRRAFGALLAETARSRKWTLVEELPARHIGKRIRPDGTVRDHYQLPRGFWEAKDSADDLDTEIRKKIAAGYPLENTIFQTPDRAVLYQDKQVVLDLDLTEPPNLCELLNRFLDHAPKPIIDFEAAVGEFTDRVPELGRGLAAIIADAHEHNTRFRETFAGFFALCKTALNPNIAREAVDEMLVQHLLTERLFRTVFDNPEFLHRNAIANEVEKVIDALASKSFTREAFLAGLDRFYVAIERAAHGLDDFSEKQHFLNTIYERFFQGYCVRTADTHGIVYTPQPIVDFMCASVEHVLDAEFGKKLGDEGVVLLDPCTGTGNFVVNLMRRAAERGRKHLKRMYTEQLYANEIMLLPYYIAALNIEHAYFELTGEYEPFEGLCFVDTLDLAEARQHGLFTEKNLERVRRQKAAPITVVIGNPPYNVGQMVHNERNKNRPYPVIDKRVRNTYSAASQARSRSKLNDPYVKFFRWSADRLADLEGLVCLVSNNSFVHKNSFDGMRLHMRRDYGDVLHLDLQGDVRLNPTLSGTQYNVFGVKVGIGITMAIKRRPRGQSIRYATVDKLLRRQEKLAWLVLQESVSKIEWDPIIPDAREAWIVKSPVDDVEGLVALATDEQRTSSGVPRGVIFKDYSLGAATHRDAIV